MCKIGFSLWFSERKKKKKKKVPFCWESARFWGWNLPVRTALTFDG